VNNKISYCSEGADRTRLSGIARPAACWRWLFQTCKFFRLFAVWFEFIRQRAPTCTVQEVRSLRGYRRCRGLKVVKSHSYGAVPIHLFRLREQYNRLKSIRHKTEWWKRGEIRGWSSWHHS